MVTRALAPQRKIVTVVNMFWERLSAALGEDFDPGLTALPAANGSATPTAAATGTATANGTAGSKPMRSPNASVGWDWRHMGGGESRHSFQDLRRRGIDLVRPQCGAFVLLVSQLSGLASVPKLASLNSRCSFICPSVAFSGEEGENINL